MDLAGGVIRLPCGPWLWPYGDLLGVMSQKMLYILMHDVHKSEASYVWKENASKAYLTLLGGCVQLLIGPHDYLLNANMSLSLT